MVDRMSGPRPPTPLASRDVWVKALRLLLLLACWAALAAYLVVLYRMTLTPVAGTDGLTPGNTDPGASIELYLDHFDPVSAALQIGGNLLLCAPLGLLLPVVTWSLRGPLRLAAAVAILMTVVELAQGFLVPGRAFDVDDLILNVIGATLAYLVLGRRLSRGIRPSPGI
ncbi:MAG: VanZ family protein [Carbonactinosporaceae bacterium]